MLDAIEVISRERREVQFVIVVAPSRTVEETKGIISQNNNDRPLLLVHHQTRGALAASDAAAVARGTATLEAALVETPMVIVYKESFVNWHTLGRLITAEHYGLANLIAGERLVTELMQNDLNGKRLAAELLSLLDQERNKALRLRLHEVTSLLGEGGASSRAADHILKALRVKS